MIRNVIFDMANTLVYFHPKVIMRKAGIGDADLDILEQDVFHSLAWVQMDRGTISLSEGIRRMEAALPEHLRQYAELLVMNWWKYDLPEIPGMANLIHELNEAGYRTYILSNAAVTFHDYVKDLPGYAEMQGTFVSADYGCLKPEKEIFEVFLNRFQLKAAESIFIDDAAANAEGAIHAGLHGIAFYGNAVRLRNEIYEIIRQEETA